MVQCKIDIQLDLFKFFSASQRTTTHKEAIDLTFTALSSAHSYKEILTKVSVFYKRMFGFYRSETVIGFNPVGGVQDSSLSLDCQCIWWSDIVIFPFLLSKLEVQYFQLTQGLLKRIEIVQMGSVGLLYFPDWFR